MSSHTPIITLLKNDSNQWSQLSHAGNHETTGKTSGWYARGSKKTDANDRMPAMTNNTISYVYLAATSKGIYQIWCEENKAGGGVWEIKAMDSTGETKSYGNSWTKNQHVTLAVEASGTIDFLAP